MLSDRKIKSLLPKEKRYEILDRDGLKIRVSPTGRKVFYYVYRSGSSMKPIRIGEYPLVSLKEAREKTDRMRRLREEGLDPALTLKERKQNTVRCLVDEWLRDYAKPNKATWKEDQRSLEKDCIPEIGDMPASEVKRRDIQRVMRRLLDRGAKREAGKILARM